MKYPLKKSIRLNYLYLLPLTLFVKYVKMVLRLPNLSFMYMLCLELK